jgi:hypothetical protein
LFLFGKLHWPSLKLTVLHHYSRTITSAQLSRLVIPRLLPLSALPYAFARHGTCVASSRQAGSGLGGLSSASVLLCIRDPGRVAITRAAKGQHSTYIWLKMSAQESRKLMVTVLVIIAWQVQLLLCC